MSLKVASILLGSSGLGLGSGLSHIGLRQRSSGERTFVELDTGREVFFHGVNAVVKGYPYLPETEVFDVDISLSERDHATLADLGVNVYRLGSMWKGVEPSRGQYNTAYLSKMADIIDTAEQFGIYTFLDMHQDDFSEKFCGEGVPDWAALPQLSSSEQGFPFPLQDPFTDSSELDGYPTRQDCAKFDWPSYYNTKAAASAFQALYQNVNGLLDSWGMFWAKLASTFGSRNSVLGYELINEPWAGDTIENPGLLIPSVADRKLLQPAYDRLADAIRQVDNETLIFFAAVTWDDPVPSGFDHAPGTGENSAEQSVFAFHYYTPPQLDEKTYFKTRLEDAQRLETGYMLTEFSMSTTSGDDYDTDGFVQTANAADDHLLSWTMWEYKTFCKETESSLNSDSQAASFGACKTGYGGHLIFDTDGNQNMDASKKLARTYAKAVAGVTKRMKFDPVSGDFVLEFALDISIAEPTEIFAHAALQYTSGVHVRTVPSNMLSWEVDGNIVKLRPTENAVDGQLVQVFLSNKV